LYQFGKELRSIGRLDLAEEALKRFVQGTQVSQELLKATLILGEISEQKKDYDRAEEYYSEILRRKPTSADAVTARLRIASIRRNVRGDWAGAMEVYESLLRGPRHVRGRTDIAVDYADCLVALGRFEDAREQYGDIEKVMQKPGSLEKVAFRMGQVFFYAGEFDSSRAVFLDVATRFPNGLHVNDALAVVLLIDDSDSPDILQQFALADWLDYAGHPDSAIAVLEAISEESENETMAGSAALRQARILNRLDRGLESVSVLNAYLKLYPESRLAPHAQKGIADTYAQVLDDQNSARQAYEETVLRYPESVVALEVRTILEKMRQIP
jgi:tetratricopeptide (TPR) repeat protein